MKRLGVLVGLAAVAALAIAVFSGSAGARQTTGNQVQVASLQAQVNELRSELICFEAVAGDGYAQDWFTAESANGTPKGPTSINDHGVCARIGLKQLPPTDSSSVLTQPFTTLINRAFGH